MGIQDYDPAAPGDPHKLDERIATLVTEVLQKLDDPTTGPSIGAPTIRPDILLNRTDVSLSSHPLLREVHPDYCPVTRADHDPLELESESERFSDGYLAAEIFSVKKKVVPEQVERFRY